MLNNIYRWFVKYDTEITWFLIGWFASQFFVDFGQGNWWSAVFDLVLILINVSLYKGQR